MADMISCSELLWPAEQSYNDMKVRSYQSMTAMKDGVTWVACSRAVAVSTESRGWVGDGCSSTPPELP